MLAAIDNRRNRVARYISGHNSRVAHPMGGKRHTAETRAKLAAYNGERASSFKHGWSNTITYKSWSAMLGRCYDPRNASHRHYGAKGITVCERWRIDFMAFLNDMGERPGRDYSIDRIDPRGNYGPGNCRWLTRAEQNARRTDPGGWITRRAAQRH